MNINKPKKSDEMYVTKKMFDDFRQELKSDNASLLKEMNSKFKKVDARFNQVDARFNQVDARFDKVEAKIEKLISVVHRTNVLVEEQNSRNKYVLDGYTQLYNKIEKLENNKADM